MFPTVSLLPCLLPLAGAWLPTPDSKPYLLKLHIQCPWTPTPLAGAPECFSDRQCSRLSKTPSNDNRPKQIINGSFAREIHSSSPDAVTLVTLTTGGRHHPTLSIMRWLPQLSRQSVTLAGQGFLLFWITAGPEVTNSTYYVALYWNLVRSYFSSLKSAPVDCKRFMKVSITEQNTSQYMPMTTPTTSTWVSVQLANHPYADLRTPLPVFPLLICLVMLATYSPSYVNCRCRQRLKVR